MKSVILAAGRGTRMCSGTGGAPKCLLSFGHQSILDVQIEGLSRAGVTELAIVVGHKQDLIINHVERRHADKLKDIEFIFNPEFATTNNMYSLWLARDWVGHTRFLCLNADVLCHPDVLSPAVISRADMIIVVDREFREETAKVIIRDDRVLRLSKSISRQDCSGTFLGIAAFSPEGGTWLFDKAESEFAAGQVNQYFNDVISHLAEEGAAVDFTETGGLPWAEIDDANDWLYAQTQVYPQLTGAVPLGELEQEQIRSESDLSTLQITKPTWQPVPDR